jgi:hypothetical protein
MVFSHAVALLGATGDSGDQGIPISSYETAVPEVLLGADAHSHDEPRESPDPETRNLTWLK